MTTTADPPTTTALVQRGDVTDARIRQQLQVNRKPGFDLATASPDQLHLLYVFCHEAGLLPVLHVTLYQGKPWITLDGRIELAKRHPEYRGFKTRPLTASEKEAWMFETSDIVVECTMRTASWGEITARGRVTRADIDQALAAAQRSNKRPAPIATHPQEIAEKRAIGRCERLAFGQSVPDFEDDEPRLVIEQQRSAAETERLAARYDDIYSGEDEWARAKASNGAPAATHTVDTETGEVLEEHVAQEEAAVQPETRKSALWQQQRELANQARARGIQNLPTLNVRASEGALQLANDELAGRILEFDRDAQAQRESEQGLL